MSINSENGLSRKLGLFELAEGTGGDEVLTSCNNSRRVRRGAGCDCIGFSPKRSEKAKL